MNKKRLISFYCILTTALLLFGCTNEKVTYDKGFPTKDSQALGEFMRNSILGSKNNLLIMQNGEYIITEESTYQTENKVPYLSFTEKQLKDYYSRILDSSNPEKNFRELRSSEESKKHLYQAANQVKYQLPTIILRENNQLYIKTSDSERTFDLPRILEKFKIKRDDELIVNVESLNSRNFSISLDNTRMKDYDDKFTRIFIKQDLSDMVITRPYYEELNQAISNGKLKGYEELIFNTDLKEKFVPTVGGYGIFDVEKNEILLVEKPDYLSNDGKYVYLHGKEDKLSDGNQQIQTIENYMEGNDIYESEFKISFKKIAKEAGLKTSGVSIAKIVYFNEDYVVLALNYKAFIVGDAGYTNVIIDLQKDKDNPTVYVVDLGIH